MSDRIWTVARFPSGHWSYGGPPDSPDYEFCEVWRIAAPDARTAVKKAQAKRSRSNRKAAPTADRGKEPQC